MCAALNQSEIVIDRRGILIIFISLQRWQHRECKETLQAFCVTASDLVPNYISMIQRQNKDGCTNGGIFTTDNVTKTA